MTTTWYFKAIGKYPVYEPVKCILFVALLFVLFVAQGQQPYSFIHYDETQLPQTTIGNIQQDQYGYLWMNTQFGIVRFDGETIRVFTTANLKGLTSNRLPICARAPDNSIYFVDENNVIIKVISPNEFESIAVKDCIKGGRLPLYSRESNNDFNFLAFNTGSSYSSFIDSLKIDLGKEVLKTYTTGKKEGYIFYEDLQQKIRLCYYDGRNYTLQVQDPGFNAKHTFKLSDSVFGQSGSTAAFLFNKGKNKQSIAVQGLPPRLNGAFKGAEHILFSNASGVFLYASGNLYQYELRDRSITATLIFDHLPCVGVVNVMQEKTTGDYLVSTKSTGFYRIKKKRFSVVDLKPTNRETPGEEMNFNNNIVYAVNMWDREHIFCNGYITPVTGTGSPCNFGPKNKSRFNYFFQYQKDDHHVWLHSDQGILSYEKETGKSTPVLKVIDPKKAFEFVNGATVLVSRGAIVLLQNGHVTELYQSDSIQFTCAEKISENCLAVGTVNGPCYFYLAERRLVSVHYKDPLKVRFIFKDKSGRLWFTTYGQGLYHLTGNSILPLPLDNAGYLAIAHSILEDNNGYFWVSTNHGLFKLGYASLLSIVTGKSSKLYYTYYDKTDGFNTNEFNGGCFPSGIYQGETGNMFFPSMNGVVRFNPDSIQNVTGNSPVFIDEIIVNDTGHQHPLTGKALFSNKTSSLRIDFSSPYYEHGENIKFSYMLSNAPGEWKDLQRSRSILLNNLPGGSYQLVVRKEGATSTPVLASLDFEIRKKFTESIVFKLSLLFLVVLLVYLYFRVRLYYLFKERRRLEKLVAAKTVNQLTLIDQLKESLAAMTQLRQELEQMIEHKESIMAVLIHDIKSPLYFLNTVASHLLKGIELNAAGKNKEIAYEIANSLHRLYLFTQDFATWLNASQPGQLQKWEQVDLVKIIEEALSVYQELIDKKNIFLRRETTGQIVYGDEPMIKCVVRNLIDNAVKNTTAGTIEIETSYSTDEHLCKIVVTDEGKGMSREQINALNTYFEDSGERVAFSNTGFGHKVIKDFLYKLGGDICYRSNALAGIIVTVHLPAIPQADATAKVKHPFPAKEQTLQSLPE